MLFFLNQFLKILVSLLMTSTVLFADPKDIVEQAEKDMGIKLDINLDDIKQKAEAELGKERIADNRVFTHLRSKRLRLVLAIAASNGFEVRVKKITYSYNEALEELEKIERQLDYIKKKFTEKYGEEAMIRHLIITAKTFLDLNIKNFESVIKSKLVLADYMTKTYSERPQITPEQFELVSQKFFEVTQDPELTSFLKLGMTSEEEMNEKALRLHNSTKKVEENIRERLEEIKTQLSIVNGEISMNSPFRHKVDEVISEYTEFLRKVTFAYNKHLNIPEFMFLFIEANTGREIKPSLSDFLNGIKKRFTCWQVFAP